MSIEFILPDLGEGITEVELHAWRVKVGDTVTEHQIVLEVETDKAVVEVPAPHSGVVTSIHRAEGEVVRVGETLLTITDAGQQLPQHSASVGIVGTLPEAEDEHAVSAGVDHADREISATPLVRKLARERAIDITGMRGSGPRGSITPEDLEAVAAQLQTSSEDYGPVERLPLRGIRRTTARNVLASQRLTAFVTTMEEADVTDLSQLREREQQAVESRGTHLTFLPFFIKAVQHALREHPSLNAAIDDVTETIIIKKHYHFGIAVETPEGLMVPVIHEVERKNILELAAEIQDLGRKARERTIGLNELKGSSFTITNFGHFGGVFATPIINWPDVAILGFGRIVDRPWVHKGEIAIRKILTLSLTFDHRVTDGADAGQFLVKVVRYLEDPGLLFIESM